MTALEFPGFPLFDDDETCALLGDLRAHGLCLVVGAPVEERP